MKNLDCFNIKKVFAAETYCKLNNGNIFLSSGSKKSRLQFSLQSNEFTKRTADIYVEVISNNFFGFIKSFFLSKMNRKFVKYTYKNNTIYINVNSLSKRLGIDKKEIYAHAKNEEALASLIQKKYQEYVAIEQKVDTFFKEIIKHRYVEIEDKIKTTDGKYLSKKMLYKIIGVAAVCFKGEKNEVVYSLKNKDILLLKKQSNKKWPLLLLFTSRVLGKGTFGKVQVVYELCKGRVSIAKIAYKKISVLDAINEKKILNIVNRTKNYLGIQKTPYFLFDFKLKKQTYCGYVAPKYECSLTQVLPKLAKKDRIECARQLLTGLCRLEKKQVCHGDIKSDNCLFKRNSDGSIECVIADFGGSRSMSKRAKWPRCTTIKYNCFEDKSAFSSLNKKLSVEKNENKKEEIAKNLKELVLKRDVYAMSFILQNLLRFSSKEKSVEIILFISKMKQSSWQKRISAKQALSEFETIFPKKR